MPLNEDALRKAFFRRCEKDGSFNMAAFKTLEDGSFANTFLENLFSDFKHKCEVAYSPEVLQAMGVAVVPVKPTEDMVIAFAEEWYCQKQAIDDVKMDEAYKAMIAASAYAIKEQL